MIETFKILANIYNSRVTNFLSKSNFSTTKGHNFKLFVQHANFNTRKWFFSIRIVDIWNRLPSNVVNASNAMCFELRLDECWADLKVKFDHEAPLNYSEFNYSKMSKSQNIDIDGELSVEVNAICAHCKTCEYTCEYDNRIEFVVLKCFAITEIMTFEFLIYCETILYQHFAWRTLILK